MQLDSANSNGNGFIKLWYQLKNWAWANDVPTFNLFVHLMLAANWQDSEWKGKTIKRGDVVFGRSEWAKKTGLTEQQIRTSLKKLISTNDITSTSTNKFTIITIVNYDESQKNNNTATSKSTNKISTSKSTGYSTNKSTGKNNELSIGNTSIFNEEGNTATSKSTGYSTSTLTTSKDYPEESEDSLEKNTKKEKQAGDDLSPPLSPSGDIPPKGRVSVSKPDDVDLIIWKDFLTIRKAKKAPITETALKKLRSEAEKANKPLQEILEICITKNWQGFEAKWLIANDNAKPKPVFFNPNHAPPAEENVDMLGIVNSNEANQLAENIQKGTRL